MSPFKYFLERILAVFAALTMFAMMAVTLTDVVGRYFFNAPLPGGFEITELMLAALIFIGLPLVTAEDGHVTVDLLDPMIPVRFKPVHRILVTIVSTGAFGILSWKMWQYAFRTYDYADTTAALNIPYSPLVFLMAVMATLSTIALAIMLLFNAGKPILTPHDETQIDT